MLVGKEKTLMHCFERMIDAIINRLDREDGGVLMHGEGSKNCSSSNSYKELEKFKFP